MFYHFLWAHCYSSSTHWHVRHIFKQISSLIAPAHEPYIFYDYSEKKSPPSFLFAFSSYIIFFRTGCGVSNLDHQTEGCQNWTVLPDESKLTKYACAGQAGTSEQTSIYHKVASTSTSCLEAPPSIYRLLMKVKFDIYLLWPFGKKLIS